MLWRKEKRKHGNDTVSEFDLQIAKNGLMQQVTVCWFCLSCHGASFFRGAPLSGKSMVCVS